MKFDGSFDLDAFLVKLKGLVSRSFPNVTDREHEGLLFNYVLQSVPQHFRSRLVSDGVTPLSVSGDYRP